LDVTCRICDSRNVELFLDLGEQPHCNRLIPQALADGPEPIYPLRTGFCHDCTLVQIDYTVPKESMFSDYPYVSGTTRTLVQHFKDTAERLVSTYGLAKGDLIVDIGSNDGSFLAQYQRAGLTVLGVEPAANVARVAQNRGVDTMVRFFNEETANEILEKHGPARLVTAAGVFFHLEELHSVVRGVRALIGDDGVLVVQAIYLGSMVENLAFDQIYHEHLCYYTLRSLEALFALHGLQVFDVRSMPIHGGTIEVHAARTGRRAEHNSVAAFRAKEAAKGFGSFETYKAFGRRVWKLRDELLSVLKDFKAKGRSLYAFSAPAKGATLLNSFKIGPDLVAKAVEKNPMKVGFMIPGCRIPIVGEDVAPPDAYLMLAWNFLGEFLERERPYLEGGGAFIVPVPSVRVITRETLS
jgi:2-polyprenyl-3-methyl-5-hydroxy-6-metoxy-1,4-benzoquinol methylase